MIDVGHVAPGQIIAGRYRVERLLKAGGMGAVYVAAHVETDRKVALKLMRAEIVLDADARARFGQEARVASMIDSAHVVDVLDAGIDEPTGNPFIAMELLRGKELGDVIRERGRVSPAEALLWLSQAARGLDRAHARGIVHRDLKPENLFLAEREDEPATIKVLDFGIAKLVARAGQSSTRASGTPLYMAPEQTRRSSEIGPETDVWAIGLIAYTLLVGRPYWEAEDIHQLYTEILMGEIEPPARRAARAGVTLTPGIDAWFLRCVDREPSRRFAHAGEAVAALGLALGIDPAGAATGTPPPQPVVVVSPAPAAKEDPRALAMATTEAAPGTAPPPRPAPLPASTTAPQIAPSGARPADRTGCGLAAAGIGGVGALLASGAAVLLYVGMHRGASPPTPGPVLASAIPEPALDAAPHEVADAGPSVGPARLEPTSVAASTAIEGRERHPAAHAFDGRVETAWSEDVAGPGRGEWIEARFAIPHRIRRIRIATGFSHVSPRWGDLFPANAHLKRVRVSLDDRVVRTIDVGAEERWITVDGLDVPARTIRFTAEDVWAGTKWQDLSIAEIEIEGI